MGLVWLLVPTLISADPAAGEAASQPETVLVVSKTINCPEPDFNFRRITPRTFILTVKAKQEATFDLYINQLDLEKGGEGANFLARSGQRASPEGEKTDVFFPDLGPIMDRGGYVKIIYKSLDTGCSENGQLRVKMVRVFDIHVLQFDGGWVNGLEHDGAWNTSAEYGIRASSQWLSWLQGMVDLRYAAFGRIDTSGSQLDSLFESQGIAPADFKNPFDSRSGVFRVNMNLMYTPFRELKALSFIFGGGATSVPGDEITNMRPRFFGGVGLSVDEYSISGGDDDAATSGALHLLVARDKLWQWDEAKPKADTADHVPTVEHKQEFWRIVVEAQLEIPGLGGKNIKPALQGYIDTPLFSLVDAFKTNDNTHANSVVSISFLLHFDLTALKAIVGRN